MRSVLAVLLAVHGLIHLLGFAKAFDYAPLPQLTQPISRGMGLLWLAAAIVVMTSAVAMIAWPRSFGIFGAIAVVLSQAVILSAWRDAWAGTIVNVVLLLIVAHGWLTEGPASFRAQFDRDAAAGLARPIEETLVKESDLARHPEPVRRYLHATGVLGKPRVQNYRLHFTGRIRSAPGARWMPFEADQQSFADQPTGLFLLRARMFGLPVEAFHSLIDGRAPFRRLCCSATMAGSPTSYPMTVRGRRRTARASPGSVSRRPCATIATSARPASPRTVKRDGRCRKGSSLMHSLTCRK